MNALTSFNNSLITCLDQSQSVCWKSVFIFLTYPGDRLVGPITSCPYFKYNVLKNCLGHAFTHTHYYQQQPEIYISYYVHSHALCYDHHCIVAIIRFKRLVFPRYG